MTVRVNGKLSSWAAVLSGVPRGYRSWAPSIFVVCEWITNLDH